MRREANNSKGKSNRVNAVFQSSFLNGRFITHVFLFLQRNSPKVYKKISLMDGSIVSLCISSVNFKGIQEKEGLAERLLPLIDYYAETQNRTADTMIFRSINRYYHKLFLGIRYHILVFIIQQEE